MIAEKFIQVVKWAIATIIARPLVATIAFALLVGISIAIASKIRKPKKNLVLILGLTGAGKTKFFAGLVRVVMENNLPTWCVKQLTGDEYHLSKILEQVTIEKLPVKHTPPGKKILMGMKIRISKRKTVTINTYDISGEDIALAVTPVLPESMTPEKIERANFVKDKIREAKAIVWLVDPTAESFYQDISVMNTVRLVEKKPRGKSSPLAVIITKCDLHPIGHLGALSFASNFIPNSTRLLTLELKHSKFFASAIPDGVSSHQYRGVKECIVWLSMYLRGGTNE